MMDNPDKIITEVLIETFQRPERFCEEVALHVILLLQAEGYVIAPISPTKDMVADGGAFAAQIYGKMIDANPYRLGSDADWETVVFEHRLQRT